MKGGALDPETVMGRARSRKASIRAIQQLPRRRGHPDRRRHHTPWRERRERLVRVSICAEHNAFAMMATTDPEDREIELVAVFSPNTSPCFPGGACRQV